MKRRFILSLTVLFVLFGVGSGVGLRLLWKSSAELDKLIELHEIEDMRQDLELQITRAEQALEVSGTAFANHADELIATVRELERQMLLCDGCHHQGPSKRLIDRGIDDVEVYKRKFSQFFTAIGNNEWRQQLQVEVAVVGGRLKETVSEIRHIATPRLKQHTASAQKRIDQSRKALGITLALTFLCAFLMASAFVQRATEPISKLTDAADRIAEGEIGTRIEHRETGTMGLLLDQFNDMSVSLAAQASEVERRTDQIRQTRDMALITLARLAESRDADTGYHLERIASYCHRIALSLRFTHYASQIDDTFVDQLTKCSPLHDIGKVGVPDSILRKPGALTDEERERMRRHTVVGGDTLRTVIDEFDDHTFLEMAMEIAYCHHERWDGNGYPAGLAGEEIPLSARIVALSDAYDCITSKRVYKEPESHDEAIRRILDERGRHFDPVVTDAFLICQGEFDLIRQSYQQSEDATEDDSRPAVVVPLRNYGPDPAT